jgi:hypothetical protein
MKYIVIFAIVVLLVRIDFFMNLVEKGIHKFSGTPTNTEPLRVEAGKETIPFGEDQTLKQTSKDKFLSLLEVFHSSPDATIRVRIMEELKTNPKLFTATPDRDLEARIFALRDLLNIGQTEVLTLLIDLQNALPGQNQEMIKRFFSLLIDQNLDLFLRVYPGTKDLNCNVVNLIADPVEEEDKVNLYRIRESAVTAYLAKENLPVASKALAQQCLVHLQTQILKLTPAPAVETPPEATP